VVLLKPGEEQIRSIILFNTREGKRGSNNSFQRTPVGKKLFSNKEKTRNKISPKSKV